MAVTLQGTPSLYENASGTSVVLPYPSGIVAGELLLAMIAHSASTALSAAPVGWTNLESTANSGGGPGIGVFYRWADGSEAGSVTFATSTTAGRVTGEMQRWAGVSSTITDVPNVEGSVGVQLTYDSPAVNTASSGTLVLHVVSLNSSSASDIVTPAGMTKVIGTTGTGRRLSVFSQPMPTPGSTGTITWTQTSTTALQWTSAHIALRSNGATVGPSLLQRVVGIPATNTDTSGQVNVKVNNATSVRLRCSTDAAGTTGVVFGSAVTPSANGDARMTISGLSPNTRYYYRVMMTNDAGEVADSNSPIGRLKTAPSGPASFAFTFSSCNNGNSSTTTTAMANRNDDFALHLGDLYYADGSGTTLANMRTKINAALSAGQDLYATTPMQLVTSDHEGMNNNTTAGNAATAWSNWNIARSELYPNPQQYFSFNWGRVRVICLDTRSFKSDPAATDDASKTALGATQKQWLKDEITNLASDRIAIIANETPWVGAAQAGDDGWFGYTTERTELANHFSASGKNIIMLGGDQHALSANDGSTSPGGIAVFQASPLNQAASIKGGPWTQGPYPASGSGNAQQYGRVVVTDSGTSIAVNFKGYSADGTERLSLTKTYTVAATGNSVKLARAEVGVVASTTTIGLHRSEVSAVAGGASAPKLLSSAVSGVGSADPGPNVRSLEAGLTVQMDATAPGSPTSYTWDQVAGPAVPIITSGLLGESATYRVPYLKADADLVFRVVANYADGTKSGSGITRHGVIHTSNLVAGSSGLTPVGFRVIGIPVPELVTPPGGYQPLGVAGNWSLKLSEEFNELDTSRWTPYWFTPTSQMNNAVTDPANVAIENGQLTLMLSEAGRGALVSSNPKDGVAGHIGYEFTSGFVESRIFFPGNGATLYNWPAFWSTGQMWPGNGECDIAEVTGWDGVNSLTSNYHYKKSDGTHGSKGSGTIPGNWGGGWHVYGLKRTPTQNTIYFDGKPVWSYTPDDASAPHYLLLNVGASVANTLLGEQSKVRVDYVRHWTES